MAGLVLTECKAAVRKPQQKTGRITAGNCVGAIDRAEPYPANCTAQTEFAADVRSPRPHLNCTPSVEGQNDRVRSLHAQVPLCNSMLKRPAPCRSASPTNSRSCLAIRQRARPSPAATCFCRLSPAPASPGSRGASAPSAQAQPDTRRSSPKVFDMKKSINLWAFPYPQRMTLQECLQLAKDAGFDGIELNYDLENDLSPKAAHKEFTAIRKMADDIGIEISGLCSFLFWPYPLTSNDPGQAQHAGSNWPERSPRRRTTLGVENVLVVPGAVHIPWRDGSRAGAERRVRPARARGGGQARQERREAQGLSEHREHLLQRLPDDADGDERVRG